MLYSALGMLVLMLAGPQAKPPAGEGQGTQVARGEYIVNNVAMCVQCHTPRSSSGDLDRLQLLQGAPIPVASPWPNRPWAVRSVHIAGLPGFRDEDVLSLLMKGFRLDGRAPQPPMPQFHMNRQDAEAVIAYLRSLP